MLVWGGPILGLISFKVNITSSPPLQKHPIIGVYFCFWSINLFKIKIYKLRLVWENPQNINFWNIHMRHQVIKFLWFYTVMYRCLHGGIFKESSLCCCLYLYYQKVQLGRCDCYYGDCSVAIFPKFSFYIFIRYKILSKIFNSNVLANCIENLAYGFWFASILSHATSLWNSDLL